MRNVHVDTNTVREDDNNKFFLLFFFACSSLNYNRIRWVSGDDLPRNLIIFEMRGNPVTHFDDGALQNMNKLRKLLVYGLKFLLFFFFGFKKKVEFFLYFLQQNFI